VLIDVKVPVLAESVAEATLMNWNKKQGDVVNRGDSLIDIETDKVTLEVAAPNNGVLVEILKGDGEDVTSDEVIARLDTEAVAGASNESSAVEEPANEPEQQTLDVGEVPAETPKLSPAVRNLLEEHKLDAAKIPSSGDRLTKEDVLNYLDKDKPAAPTLNVVTTSPPVAKQPKAEPPPVAKAEPPAPQPVATAAPVSADNGDRAEERVPMTRLRRRASERLLSAQHENAILTTFNEVNMKPVMDLRANSKDEFEKVHGTKLGFMSFFTKASVEALKKFPVVNASVEGTDIIYHSYFDVGIAVSSQKGLVVPILRDADLISFADIESKIREYGEKARDSKLTIEELTGGTFTITNGGIFGSMLSTPIINPPQSAILGMHNIQDRAVVENGEIVIRPMMYVALSYDHRIIDGRDAVQFLVTVKQLIEDPARLLLQI
jgi:2-oxoglutarate dehydrogenase E2 component (dihydrolipoamide succinyltransferase)